MQRRMLIRESAEQRPDLIQTRGECQRVWREWGENRWRLDCRCDLPAIGGKRMAIRPKKMSPQDILAMMAYPFVADKL